MDLIKRVPSKEDRRLKEIILTKKADSLRQEVLHDIDMLESRIISGIPDEQLQLWREVTERMIRNLNEDC